MSNDKKLAAYEIGGEVVTIRVVASDKLIELVTVGEAAPDAAVSRRTTALIHPKARRQVVVVEGALALSERWAATRFLNEHHPGYDTVFILPDESGERRRTLHGSFFAVPFSASDTLQGFWVTLIATPSRSEWRVRVMGGVASSPGTHWEKPAGRNHYPLKRDYLVRWIRGEVLSARIEPLKHGLEQVAPLLDRSIDLFVRMKGARVLNRGGTVIENPVIQAETNPNP